MKSLVFAPLVLLCSAPRTAPEADVTLVLAAERGTKVARTFTWTYAMELQEATDSLSFDGEDPEVESVELEMSLAESVTLAFTDEYLALTDGRATEVRRHFDALSATSAHASTDDEGVSDEATQEGESELQGHTVDLAWDSEREAWGASFADGDEGGDDELLEGLEHHADLVDFLPLGPVEVGAEWSVPVMAFQNASSPAGDVQFEPTDDAEADEEDDAMEELLERADDNLTGQITARLTGVAEGRATIALELTLAASAECDAVTEEVLDEETDESVEFTTLTKVDLLYDLEGTLVWDVEHGRPVSLSIEGEAGFEIAETVSSVQEGVSIVFASNYRFAGTLVLSGSFD